LESRRLTLKKKRKDQNREVHRVCNVSAGGPHLPTEVTIKIKSPESTLVHRLPANRHGIEPISTASFNLLEKWKKR